jgi:hypothetical protein
MATDEEEAGNNHKWRKRRKENADLFEWLQMAALFLAFEIAVR